MQRRSVAAWKAKAHALGDEATVLYLAYHDPRVPWYARVYLICVVAYLFSPIDLIPDVIPILGYVDELLLMPLFVAIARRLVADEVMEESRARAAMASSGNRPRMVMGAVLVVLGWIMATLVSGWFIWRVWLD